MGPCSAAGRPGLWPASADDDRFGRRCLERLENRVIPRRGDIVHGWVEAPSTEETALVLLWAKQLMDQLRLRLIAAGKHPLHDLFVAALEPST